MKYPKLVQERMCKTPIHVTIYREGMGREGEPLTAFEADLLCNWQSSSKSVYTAEKKSVQLTATALFHADFCPDLDNIPEGEVFAFGTKRKLLQGMKARNPDGTVNYIRLDIV